MQEVAQEAEGEDGGVAGEEVGAVSDILVIDLLHPRLGILASSRVKWYWKVRKLYNLSDVFSDKNLMSEVWFMIS